MTTEWNDIVVKEPRFNQARVNGGDFVQVKTRNGVVYNGIVLKVTPVTIKVAYYGVQRIIEHLISISEVTDGSVSLRVVHEPDY